MIWTVLWASLIAIERGLVNLLPQGTIPAGFTIEQPLRWYAWLNSFLPLDEVIMPVAPDGVMGVMPAMLVVIGIVMVVYVVFTFLGFIFLRVPGSK